MLDSGLLNNRLSNRRLCLAASQEVNYGALNQSNCIVLIVCRMQRYPIRLSPHEICLFYCETVVVMILVLLVGNNTWVTSA